MTTDISGKALLTGASGFIGGRLRDALLARGLDVISIRRRGSPPAKQGRSVEADYTDGLSHDVRGTPTLFIDGVRYGGPIELAALVAATAAG